MKLLHKTQKQDRSKQVVPLALPPRTCVRKEVKVCKMRRFSIKYKNRIEANRLLLCSEGAVQRYCPSQKVVRYDASSQIKKQDRSGAGCASCTTAAYMCTQGSKSVQDAPLISCFLGVFVVYYH